jgi:bacillithiol biosynthesis cysteine-adding enzyme BshC
MFMGILMSRNPGGELPARDYGKVFTMSAGLAKSVSRPASPLQGFAFTEAWLKGETHARAALPPAEELLAGRLDALNNPEGANWQPWSEEELEELRAYNEQAGNAAGAALVDALSRSDALVVVTGQQPNLLVSPLYILYKAISAVAWARKLSSQLDRPVAPVFWVASDDDDFAELSEAWMVSHAGDLINTGRHISRGHKAAAGTPAYDWDLTESLPRLTRDLDSALGGWPKRTAVLDWLKGELTAVPDFEMSFCRLLAALLGDEFPMIFVAPRLKSMRRRGSAVLAADIQNHAAINEAVSAETGRFIEAGYPVTLARESNALNFLWLHLGRRFRFIINENDSEISAVDPASHKVVGTFSEEELRVKLSTSPGDFAPNVVTRPAVQDAALPTAMYIAGPGELAYLAVLGTAYSQLGVVRSAVVPRALVSLQIPGHQNGADANSVLQQGSDEGRRLLDVISDLTASVAASLQEMRKEAAIATPAAVKAVDKTEAHINRGIAQLKRRLARQVAPQAWEHHARVAAMASPDGKTQERILSPWNFVKPGELDALARYLSDAADFTAPGPHTIALPPWMEGTL